LRRISSFLGLTALLGAILGFGALTGSAQSSVTLAWDSSSGGAVAGYHLYQGGASGTYTKVIPAGNATNATASGLTSSRTYFFAVTAYDSTGLESDFSNEVSYTVPIATNNPPGIALTSPASGASYTAPATIPLAASVTANGHTITKVQFYNGATLLAEDTSTPYSFTWSNVSTGSYSLTARAVYDAGSTVTSAPANVAVTSASSGGTLTFSNPSAITIPDSGAGTPYPSTISGSGMAGLINNVTLTLANLSHAWVSDVAVLLVGPAGQKVLLCSNVGDTTAASNVTLTLSDAAASALPSSGALVTGTYRPAAYAPATTFSSPAPSGPYATTFSTLNGQSPNGTWSLYVFDDGPGDQGSLAGGWSLTVTTVSTAGAAPTISAIPNQSTTANTPTPAIPFTVNDTDTPVAGLTLTGGSSNPTLVPAGNIVFGGSGGNRTVTVNPAANQTGTATITVGVSDGTSSASATFVLTVNAVNPPPTVALTSPANGASYAAPATINLAATVTANSHTINKVQFYNGATLLAEDTSEPYSLTWSNVSAGSYSLTVRAIYDGGGMVWSAPVNLAVTGLPVPWQTADIGSLGAPGNASISGGLSTVAGAGTITGSADAFRFLYQTMSGDGNIDACVSSAQNTGTSGRVGVMIRESLTSGSEYAFMGISPGGTFRWQRRSSTGGTTSSSTSGSGTPPNVWARLVRTNGTFYGYKSANGTNWTLVSSRSIAMATNIYIGLAVASGTSTVLNTSTFTNVTVVP
jgi:subtilisin-like proprotein convertase family protein